MAMPIMSTQSDPDLTPEDKLEQDQHHHLSNTNRKSKSSINRFICMKPTRKIRICKHCGKKCYGMGKLIGHIRMEHPKKVELVSCGPEQRSEEFPPAPTTTLQSDTTTVERLERDRRNRKAAYDRRSICMKPASKLQTCKYCQKRCRGRGNLLRHVNSEHLNKLQLTRPEPQTTVTVPPPGHQIEVNSSNYAHPEIHVPKKHGQKCLFCGKIFPYRDKLERHMTTHTKEKAYQCSKCKIAFSHKETLTKHMSAHSNNDFRCQHCKLSFTRRNHLKEHLKSTHGNDETSSQSTAELCSPKNLKIPPKYRYNCPKCPKGYQWPSYLRRHIISHTKLPGQDFKPVHRDETKKSFKCQPAPRVQMQNFEVNISSNQKQVSVNVQLPTNQHKALKNRRKAFHCPYCKKSWTTKSLLLSHMVVHRQDKRLDCVICKRAFKLNQDSVRHMKTPHFFKCSRCDLAFTRERHLNEHSSVHPDYSTMYTEASSEIDPPMPDLPRYNEIPDLGVQVSPIFLTSHECLVCRKDYPSKQRLLIHSQKHIQHKDFRCDVCKLNFTSKQQLDSHLSSQIHYLNILKCEKCNLSFSNEALFKEHAIAHENVAKGQNPTTSSALQNSQFVKPRQIKQFQCSRCPKVFQFLEDLQMHSAVHMESQRKPDKPAREIFNCEHCGKHFFKEEVLKLHVCSNKEIFKIIKTKKEVQLPHINYPCGTPTLSKVSTLTEKYECQLCGKMLGSLVTMENHSKMHTGDRAHVCNVTGCKKSYVTGGALKMHQQIKHPLYFLTN